MAGVTMDTASLQAIAAQYPNSKYRRGCDRVKVEFGEVLVTATLHARKPTLWAAMNLNQAKYFKNDGTLRLTTNESHNLMKILGKWCPVMNNNGTMHANSRVLSYLDAYSAGLPAGDPLRALITSIHTTPKALGVVDAFHNDLVAAYHNVAYPDSIKECLRIVVTVLRIPQANRDTGHLNAILWVAGFNNN